MWVRIHADYWENDSMDLIHQVELDEGEKLFYCHAHGSSMVHDCESETLEEAMAAFEFIVPPIKI